MLLTKLLKLSGQVSYACVASADYSFLFINTVLIAGKKDRVPQANCETAISVKISRTVNAFQGTNVTAEEVKA